MHKRFYHLFILLLSANYCMAQGWQFADEIKEFKKEDSAHFPMKNSILFVGSSSFRFWKDVNSYFPEYPIINRGFGGSHLADSVHFAPRIVLKYKPRLVVLYAGDNDIAAKKSPEKIAADFREFATLVHKDLPATKIVFLSIKPSVNSWS